MKESKLYLHSVQRKTPNGEAIIVRESLIDNETLAVTPNLRYIKNPKRTFYVTKPEFRNHKFKKERCHISELDEFTVYNYELIHRLKQAIGDSSHITDLDYICRNPYIYGADISIESLIKMRYRDEYKLEFLPIVTGFLDIETSVVSNIHKEILLITITHDTKVYTAIRRQFMYEPDEDGNMKHFSVEDVIKECHLELGDLIAKHNFEFEYFVGEYEIDLINWIMSKIFLNKTDFIGIWNMNFDIPVIIDAIKRSKNDPVKVLSHPDIPDHLRYMWYKEDKGAPSHWTLKWHWLTLAGYTQFVDSLGLYSQVRKTKRFEDSYSLDHILNINLGLGKLRIPGADDHFTMQTKHAKKYIIYNQMDTIGLQLLEWKNEDISSMVVMAGETPVSQFGYATVTRTNSLYKSQKKRGFIVSSRSTADPTIGVI